MRRSQIRDHLLETALRLFNQHGFLYVTNGLPPPDAKYHGSGWYTWSTDFEL